MANKPRERILSCGHSVSRNEKRPMQRFLETDKRYTLEEVLDEPINLNAMPSDFNRDSPTPLDPANVRVLGVGYEHIAREFMLGELGRNGTLLSDEQESLAGLAESEIVYQHSHRMIKNSDTMDNWREYAASNKPIDLSYEEAEGVMQVRAGISKPRAVASLAVRNPDTLGGGIEIAKRTSPFCLAAHIEARRILRDRVRNIPGAALNEEATSPYRFSIDQHNMALITKTLLGTIALQGVTLEVVTRESGIMYDPQKIEEIPESITSIIAGSMFAIAPLDITSYIRVVRK